VYISDLQHSIPAGLSHLSPHQTDSTNVSAFQDLLFTRASGLPYGPATNGQPETKCLENYDSNSSLI